MQRSLHSRIDVNAHCVSTGVSAMTDLLRNTHSGVAFVSISLHASSDALTPVFFSREDLRVLGRFF